MTIRNILFNLFADYRFPENAMVKFQLWVIIFEQIVTLNLIKFQDGKELGELQFYGNTQND